MATTSAAMRAARGGSRVVTGRPLRLRSRGTHVSLPGGEAVFALRRRERRLEEAIAAPGLSEVPGRGPDAGREPGQVAGAERARLHDRRALGRQAEAAR